MSIVRTERTSVEQGRVESWYGETALAGFLCGGVCCGLHTPLGAVVGAGKELLPGVVGSHPAFQAAEQGLKRPCCAGVPTLKTDRQLVRAALTMGVPGFAYMRKRGLPEVRRWETGSIIGLTAFGRGYCALRVFRDKARFRVARILGPAPYVSDICVLFRLMGAYRSRARFRGVAPGLYHCEEGDEEVSGMQIMRDLLGILELDPGARMGLDPESENDAEEIVFMGTKRCDLCEVTYRLDPNKSHNCDWKDVEVVEMKRIENLEWRIAGGSSGPSFICCCKLCGQVVDNVDEKDHVCVAEPVGVGTIGKSGLRGLCEACGFVVKLEGHELRCRLPRVRNAAKELVGDAWHGLDVKTAIVLSYERGVAYTEIAKRFLSAKGQRAYLEGLDKYACKYGSSDSVWATEFETRYVGQFRKDYLTWLVSLMPENKGCDPRYVWAREERDFDCGELGVGSVEIKKGAGSEGLVLQSILLVFLFGFMIGFLFSLTF